MLCLLVNELKLNGGVLSMPNKKNLTKKYHLVLEVDGPKWCVQLTRLILLIVGLS